MKSKLLVAIQFSCIAYFIISHGIFPIYSGSWVIVLAAIALGLSAVFSMRLDRVSVFPEPRKSAQLVVTGPYKYIRHPMYTAVLLFCLAYLIDHGGWIDWLAYIILLINQLIKLNFEEKMLEKKFENYKSYRRETKRLIPFLY